MLFLWVVCMLFLSGRCTGADYTEAKVGERVTFRETVNAVSQIADAKGRILCKYDWEGPNHVTYPHKHECYNVWNELYFTIKNVELEDTMIYLWQSSSGNEYDQHVLHVYLPDNSDLHNKVLGYGNYSRLAYHTEMEDEVSIHWSFLSHSSEAIDIYYAKKDTGGVLSNDVGSYKEATGGFGVSINSVTFNEAGRYQYYVTDPPHLDQKAFDVAITRNFGCQPAEYLINGKEQSHSCSAEVSNGDIAPEFTWFRNGQFVNGNLSQEEGSATTKYTYTHTFEAGWNELGVNYTCLQKFKYVGPDSDIRDTSDPTYRDTCILSYVGLEFAPYDAVISPGSDEGPLILTIGQEFTCSANGSGSLSYEWYCGNSGQRYTGQILEITNQFFTNGYTNCECTAYTTLGDGVRYTTSKAVQFAVLHQSFVVTPPPPVIFSYIGDNVQLNCTLAPFINSSETNDDFNYQWTANFKDDDDAMKNFIYTASKNNYAVFDAWRDTFEAGDLKHDLVMKRAKFELEGLYRCEAINYPDVYTFNVEVYFTDRVNCSSPNQKVKTNQTVEGTCQVEHSTSIKPEMVWYAGDSVMPPKQPAETIRNEASAVTESGVNFEANPGVIYKCGITFRSGSTAFTDECVISFEFDDDVEDELGVSKDVGDKHENDIIKQN